MISLSETILTCAGLFGLGASAATVGGTAAPPAFRDLPPDDAPRLTEGRSLSPDADAADDPFFTAVAEALREAGYLDS